MTQQHTIDLAGRPPEVHGRSVLALFWLALLVPYGPVFAVVVLQELNQFAGCAPGFPDPCMVAGMDIAAPGRAYIEPLTLTYRSFHLLHYLAYGALLATLGHLAFRATWSRLAATCLGAALITLPVATLEVYWASVQMESHCERFNGDVDGSCQEGRIAVTQVYMTGIFMWAQVMVLPVAAILTVVHTIICLGRNVSAHIRKHA